MKLSLATSLLELNQHDIAGLSQAMARKLAMAVAAFSYKNDLSEVTIEDLLNYFPIREIINRRQRFPFVYAQVLDDERTDLQTKFYRINRIENCRRAFL